MRVDEIMNRTPATVRVDQTFGEALQLLASTRQTILPAVDAEGVYRGLFDLRDVWTALLPKAAHMKRNSLEDLSFATSSDERLRELLAESAELPVSRFLNKEDAPPLFSNSPVIQAILSLDEHGETLAVIDRQTRKLVGVLSAWQVLDALR